MSVSRVLRRRVAYCACASLLAISFAAYAEYKDSYAKALEAYKGGRYADAKQLLLSAIAEHPEPAARVRLYGTRFEPYLPQHYLGLIAVAQGDCAGAQAAWAMSENAQIVAQVGEAASEEKSAAAKCGGIAIAQKSSAPAPAAPKPSEPTVAQKPASPPAPAPDQSKAPLPKPDSDKNVASNDSQQKSRPSEPETKLPVPPSERPAEKPPAPPAEKAGAPEQLIATFENFLNGNLREVARSNPDTYTDARLRFHAYLVRSGARYTLSQLGDQNQLEAARADARQAHALNAGAQPDAVLFSPHFRNFYAENR